MARSKVSILNDGENDVYPVTAAKVVYLSDNKTNVEEKLNSIEGSLDNTIYAEIYNPDDQINISLEDKDSIFRYITKLEAEIKELKSQIK